MAIGVLGRLELLIKYKKHTIKSFEREFGFSNGSLSAQLKKDNGTIGVDRVEKILLTYSDISPSWLLIGEGEMLKKVNYKEIDAVDNNLSGVSEDINYILFDKIEKKDIKIEELSKEIGRLEERNRQLEKELLEHKKIANLSKSSDLKTQTLKPNNKINNALIK